jgi:deltex-like protein
MPDGEMKWRIDKKNRLPGFENDTAGQEDHANFSEGTIIFEYNFPSGAQKNEKGETVEYYSDYRKAFLPYNTKGIQVFKKLILAFKLRLTF